MFLRAVFVSILTLVTTELDCVKSDQGRTARHLEEEWGGHAEESVDTHSSPEPLPQYLQ